MYAFGSDEQQNSMPDILTIGVPVYASSHIDTIIRQCTLYAFARRVRMQLANANINPQSERLPVPEIF